MGKFTETAFNKTGKWTPEAVTTTYTDGLEKKLEFEAEPEIEQEVKLKSGYFKTLKTVLLVSTWIAMGLYSGITGPTVPDFSERLHTDYDSVGFAIAFRSVGKMVGSVTLGYLRDRFSSKGDFLLTCALLLVAGSVVAKPWVATIAVLAGLYSLEGFGHGGINSVGNSMLVLMWKEKAAVPVHLLHFGYGVGALVAPLIARPFLSIHQTVNITDGAENGSYTYPTWDNSINESAFLNSSQSNSTITEEITIKASEIEIPYVIVAGIVSLVGGVYLGLFLYRPTRKLTTSFGRSTYTKPWDAPFLKDRPKSAIPILALFFFFYMMVSAIDRALGSFLFTYAVESGIGFTKSEAAYLNTAFFGCYAAGRVGIGLLALKLPVKYIIFTEVYLMTACSAVITFYAYNKRLLLWVFSCSLAFFFGPIFPSGIAWVDRYVPVYGLVVAIFDVGNGVGAFTANWMSGHLISTMGPRSLLYFTFGAAVVLCAVLALAQAIGSRRGDRHINSHKSVEKEKDNASS